MPCRDSLDLRERLFQAHVAGLRAAEVERTLGVGQRTRRRTAARRRAEAGSPARPKLPLENRH